MPSALDAIIASMKLSSLGEFGLIELIRKASYAPEEAATSPASHLVVGIGDDAAAWECDDRIQLGTTDSLVENVHFTLSTTSWHDLGHKSLAVNLSDIAAMGGTPTYAFVSLCCPPDVDSDDVMAYYDGLNSLAHRHGVTVAGGNLTRSSEIVTTVFVTGVALTNSLMTRSSARPGQVVAVTGTVGGAGAAVAALQRGQEPEDIPIALMNALLRPEPRVREGRILADCGITCAIDTSDGLLADLQHICDASTVEVTVELERVPVNPSVPSLSNAGRLEALQGGEDYELLVVGSDDALAEAAEKLKVPLTIIGRVNSTSVTPSITVVDGTGTPVDAARQGWNHFHI